MISTASKLISVFILSFILTACVTGDYVRDLTPGMNHKQVESIMGKPDGFKKDGLFTIYKYTNRLISGWSWDKTDYVFIFKNDNLVEYGSGEVRERNVGGFQTLYIYHL